jgi:hypothetical protein
MTSECSMRNLIVVVVAIFSKVTLDLEGNIYSELVPSVEIWFRNRKKRQNPRHGNRAGLMRR